MANSGVIDEIIGAKALSDVEALKLKLQELEKQFIQTASAASGLSSFSVGGGRSGGGGIRNTTAQMTELERETKKLIELNKQYGSDLTRIQDLQQKQRAANKRAIQDETNDYLKLRNAHKAAEAEALQIGVQYGKNSQQFKDAAANANKLREQFVELHKELGNHRDNVGNYAGALSKVWSALRQAAYILPGLGIAGIMNIIWEGLKKVVEWMDLFSSAAANARSIMEQSFGSDTYKGAISNIESLKGNLELARQGLISHSKAISDYNEGIGLVMGTVKTWDELEQKVSQSTPAYIEMMYHRAQAEQYLAKAIEAKTKIQILSAQSQNPDLWDIFKAQAKGGWEDFKKTGSFSGLFSRMLFGDPTKDINAYFDELMAESKRNMDEAEMNFQNELNISNLISNKSGFKDGKKSQGAKVKAEKNPFSPVYYMPDPLQEFEELKERWEKMRKLAAEYWEEWKKDLDPRIHADIDAEITRPQETDSNADKLNNQLKERAEKKRKDREDELADIKKRNDLLKEYKSILNSAENIALDISKIISDRELLAIEKRNKALDESYKREMRFIEQSGYGAREKEKMRQRLEAETEAKRKQNDRDRVRALRKQASLEKAVGIVSAIANTVQAVTGALARFEQDGYIAYVNAALLGAAGAAQVASLVATPLPQYGKGRKGGKAEMAIVGEMGTEVIRTKDGKLIATPNKPTVTFLPEGADVIPNHEVLKNAAFVRLVKEQSVTLDKYQDALIAKYEEELTELREIKRAIIDKPIGGFVYNGGFDAYKQSNIR